MIFLWIKVVHLFSVIAWMVGLFYLPRLFVYHSVQEMGSATDKVFIAMEGRLLKIIMRPAATVAILSGIGLAHLAGVGMADTWFMGKLTVVVALCVFHGFLEVRAKAFGLGLNRHGARFFRILNEVPSVLLALILVFVIVKPLT